MPYPSFKGVFGLRRLLNYQNCFIYYFCSFIWSPLPKLKWGSQTMALRSYSMSIRVDKEILSFSICEVSHLEAFQVANSEALEHWHAPSRNHRKGLGGSHRAQDHHRTCILLEKKFVISLFKSRDLPRVKQSCFSGAQHNCSAHAALYPVHRLAFTKLKPANNSPISVSLTLVKTSLLHTTSFPPRAPSVRENHSLKSPIQVKPISESVWQKATCYPNHRGNWK